MELVKNLWNKTKQFFVGLPPMVQKLVLAGSVFIVSLMAIDGLKTTVTDRYLKQVEHHQKIAVEALQRAEQAELTVDSLIIQSNELDVKNQKLQDSVKTLKSNVSERKRVVKTTTDKLSNPNMNSADSLKIVMQILPQKDSIIVKQDQTIGILEEQKQVLESKVAVKDSIISVVVKVNEDLTSVVDSIPKVDKCSEKFFFCKINKPSRVTSFVSGGVVALVTLVVLK